MYQHVVDVLRIIPEWKEGVRLSGGMRTTPRPWGLALYVNELSIVAEGSLFQSELEVVVAESKQRMRMIPYLNCLTKALVTGDCDEGT